MFPSHREGGSCLAVVVATMVAVAVLLPFFVSAALASENLITDKDEIIINPFTINNVNTISLMEYRPCRPITNSLILIIRRSR